MKRTKNEIIDAFMQLLTEKSYNKITVQNIAERCQINRNTFYYHFADIPQLVEAALDSWIDKIIEKNAGGKSPWECLRVAAAECMNHRTELSHLYRPTAHRDFFISCVKRVIFHAVDSFMALNAPKNETKQQEKERMAMVWFYQCLFSGVLLDWFDNDLSYDLSKRLDLIYEAMKDKDAENIEELATSLDQQKPDEDGDES